MFSRRFFSVVAIAQESTLFPFMVRGTGFEEVRELCFNALGLFKFCIPLIWKIQASMAMQ